MAFLDRFPAFKKVFVNPYQALLLGGAAAATTLTLSPLPLLLLAGGELMVSPFLVERVKRRMEAERKGAEQKRQLLSQEQRYRALGSRARERFGNLRQLCERIQANCRELSPAGEGKLPALAARFDAILATGLRHLWLMQKYEEMIAAYDEGATRAEVARLEAQLAAPGLEPRAREAIQTNLEILARLEPMVRQNATSHQTLVAELDSLEDQLGLLLQRSIGTTDAVAFSVEIDRVLARAEADAKRAEEMERFLEEMPEAPGGRPVLSEKLKRGKLEAPEGGSSRGSRRRRKKQKKRR